MFQQHYRVSAMTYLNELRLRRAKEQLVIGKRSVRDIAERCGFRDESYFRRHFKAAAGITPLHFAGQSRERIADMSYAYVSHLSKRFNPARFGSSFLPYVPVMLTKWKITTGLPAVRLPTRCKLKM
ncbi:helix-turn-helix transcriptional regulator [Paenibacillus campi]|uniref:helix-turn-helix transcriptional regulator n=1 Tax=Paenibacillus campi TaxID=3106031 RepID=UPI002AFDF475|nr:helix-turn-helix transcriptional regulator [Paenibacillus sp. SGZ-1014]